MAWSPPFPKILSFTFDNFYSIKMFQSDYPELLELAALEKKTLCLPDVRSIRDVPLDVRFFSQHLLQEDESGYYSSDDNSVLIEKKNEELR